MSTRNKLDKTVTPQETAKITEDNAKKALDVNEKAVLLKQKSARELGELATDINVIARNAHMETNLEMEIVPQGL
ncbi:putative lateral flagellar export/assembly protein LafU, partial [Citrobacter freundii]